jgi:HD-like signal output (HDOD) protein
MPTAQELLKKFRSIKTLPHIAIRLTKLLADEKSTMQDFENIIKADPTLVLRMLRVCNSPFYGLWQKIDSISRAVMIIGMKNLRNMIVTDALRNIFEEGPDEDIFSRSRLWLHSVAVGICSKMISERIFGRMGEDVYLCGILHDIGIIIEDQVAHDLVLQICKTYTPDSKPITEYEREVMGTDHCEIGYILAREWKIPVEVQEGIRYHHNLERKISPSSETGIVQMADYLVSELNYPAISGIEAKLSPDMVDYLRDNSYEFKALLQDLPGEISKAEQLYSSGEE